MAPSTTQELTQYTSIAREEMQREMIKQGSYDEAINKIIGNVSGLQDIPPMISKEDEQMIKDTARSVGIMDMNGCDVMIVDVLYKKIRELRDQGLDTEEVIAKLANHVVILSASKSGMKRTRIPIASTVSGDVSGELSSPKKAKHQ